MDFSKFFNIDCNAVNTRLNARASFRSLSVTSALNFDSDVQLTVSEVEQYGGMFILPKH